MSDMTPEKAQALLDGWATPVGEAKGASWWPVLASAYIAQAAELTRLRAKVEAADKLAEAVADIVRHFPDTAQKKLRAALSAYEGGKG